MNRKVQFVGALLMMVMAAALSRGQDAAKTPAPWPSSQEGLAFAFATAHFKTPVIAFDKDGKRISSCEFLARGRARYDRNFAMVTSGGSFVLKGGEEYPAVACKKSGALTVEAYLAPLPSAASGTGTVLSLTGGTAAANLTLVAPAQNLGLVQDKNKLLLTLRTSATQGPAAQTVELCTLADAKPYHLAVTYSDGALLCFINGKEAARIAAIKGDLSNWEAGHLVFGDDWVAGRNWPGTLEGVALLSRALSAQEIAKDADAYLAKVAARKPVPVLKVKGKLVARSKVPEAKEIAPYYQSLATFEYDVEAVSAGSYDGKKIRVAHWGMMEKTILPIANRPLGQSYELELQPMEANRQLESQWLSDTLEPADLPLFFDVSP